MPVERVRVATAVAEVSVPARAGRPAGVRMAGFRGRAETPIELRMVPYPALTVIVDFGDGLLVDDAGGARHGGRVVIGLAPARVRGSGRDVDLLQVRLSPVVAHAVFGGCSELSGTVVALDDLWGRDAERTQERLRAAGSWDERFAIAEAALARRCAAGPAVDAEVAFSWERLVASRGRARVERLAAEVGWSRKRLWSRFGSQIGLPPKRAANLVRFDHAAHRLAAGHRAAQVAAESGFVDQSHLHRDVMAFAGMTPAAVAVAPWLAVDYFAWPRAEHFSKTTRPRGGDAEGHVSKPVAAVEPRT